MGCLAGLVNQTILYDNGGLRFVLYGEGCKSGKNSSTVTIILLCRQGTDNGRPELFSQVGTDDKTFCQTFMQLKSVATLYRRSLFSAVTERVVWHEC